MIDGAKLLGGLLNGSLNSTLGGLGGMGRGRLPGKTALGMGILGVAMAAFEHFRSQNRDASPPATGSPGSGSSPSPPPRSAPPAPPAPGAAPPPFGGSSPPPPPGSVPPSPSGTDPVLLLRAMISAAHADGSLDDAERRRITSHLERARLSGEERSFLASELEAPRPLADIVASVKTPADAEQVFAVSLLAVEVDSQAERAYLEQLRQALGIEPLKAVEIARSIGR